MFRPLLVFLALCMMAVAANAGLAQTGDESTGLTISTSDATRYVGMEVTICGPVAGTAYFPHLRGEPTFVNFDRQYPEQSLTVVIWGKFRGDFEEAPDRLYAGKNLCVTGRIETYKGKPQIVVQGPDQVEVMDAGLAKEQFSYEERVLLKAMLAALDYAVDPGTGEWESSDDAALKAFQVDRGLEGEEGQGPRTLRALAQAVDQVPAEERTDIIRLMLLNLAQREESASRK